MPISGLAIMDQIFVRQVGASSVCTVKFSAHRHIILRTYANELLFKCNITVDQMLALVGGTEHIKAQLLCRRNAKCL